MSFRHIRVPTIGGVIKVKAPLPNLPIMCAKNGLFNMDETQPLMSIVSFLPCDCFKNEKHEIKLADKKKTE
jgi:hypothetical protein